MVKNDEFLEVLDRVDKTIKNAVYGKAEKRSV